MSQAEIQDIFDKLSTDNGLEKQFLNALGELSKADANFKKQLLKVLDVKSSANKEKMGWQILVSNLKMEAIVQVILTGLLIVVFAVNAYLTFAQLTTKPEGIRMSDGRMEMYDPFTRAKDLLVLILPIFTTVISFWLGFSIQEKKVNQADAAANKHRERREEVDKIMAKIEGRMMTIQENDDIENLSNDIHKIMES